MPSCRQHWRGYSTIERTSPSTSMTSDWVSHPIATCGATRSNMERSSSRTALPAATLDWPQSSGRSRRDKRRGAAEWLEQDVAPPLDDRAFR